MNRPTCIETWALRDDMRARLTKRSQSGLQLFAQLRDDWGHLGERRMWRTVRWLVDRGFAVRVDCGYVAGYAPENQRDYRDWRRLYLFERKRCYDCETDLEPKQPWWYGPRCSDCYYAHQAREQGRRRKIWMDALICVRCRVSGADLPFVHCRDCLDALAMRRRAA